MAPQFPALWGPSSPYNLTSPHNQGVAALSAQLVGVKGQRTQAQILVAALAVHVTDSNLAVATASFGFNVTPDGTGVTAYNVGGDGTTIGLSNNSCDAVAQLLQQANLDTPNGTFNAGACNDIFRTSIKGATLIFAEPLALLSHPISNVELEQSPKSGGQPRPNRCKSWQNGGFEPLRNGSKLAKINAFARNPQEDKCRLSRG